MKIRAKSEVKLSNGRTNMTYTFVAGTPLEKVIEGLLVEFGCEKGKDAITNLAKRVAGILK